MAPFAFKTTFCPIQIDEEIGLIETVGNGLTVTTTVLVLLQPLAFVPITV